MKVTGKIVLVVAYIVCVIIAIAFFKFTFELISGWIAKNNWGLGAKVSLYAIWGFILCVALIVVLGAFELMRRLLKGVKIMEAPIKTEALTKNKVLTCMRSLLRKTYRPDITVGDEMDVHELLDLFDRISLRYAICKRQCNIPIGDYCTREEFIRVFNTLPD